MSEFRLSKSRFCEGVQCPKRLWYKKHMPEAFDESTLDQGVLDNGNEVGKLAQGLFGEHVVVKDDEDRSNMIKETEKLLAEGKENICEASFSYDNNFCSVDILRNFKNKEVELYEVKSSTDPSEIYKYDIAFQYYVLKQLGYNVKKACLVHLNKEYILEGELDIHKLFKIDDYTQISEDLLSYVEENIKKFKEYAVLEKEPECEVGAFCFGVAKKSYECGYRKVCHKKLPKDGTLTVFDIAGLNKKTKIKLYNKNIITFQDVYNANVITNEKQNEQVEFYVKDLPPKVNKKEIKEFLDKLKYPQFYLDFESVQSPIPIYQKTNSYQQVVTQYSLHIIEKEGGEIQHKEFLAYPDSNVVKDVATQLIKDIPKEKGGSVIVYNKSFENTRMKEMIEMYPEFTDGLQSIIDRVQDLDEPFKQHSYYEKALNGSHSIKSVLPTLCPNDPSLDYHALEGVQNGNEAKNEFLKMRFMDKEELEKSRAGLLKYCCLDTLAEVKVVERLKEIVNEN